jgi:hypothetical protein
MKEDLNKTLKFFETLGEKGKLAYILYLMDEKYEWHEKEVFFRTPALEPYMKEVYRITTAEVELENNVEYNEIDELAKSFKEK